MVHKDIKNIPENIINKFNKCVHCNESPVIINVFDNLNGEQESYISCPNCEENFIRFYKKIDELVEIWNKLNPIHVFIPTNPPKQIKESCYFCKCVNNCKYAISLEKEKLNYYVCDNFEANLNTNYYWSQSEDEAVKQANELFKKYKSSIYIYRVYAVKDKSISYVVIDNKDNTFKNDNNNVVTLIKEIKK